MSGILSEERKVRSYWLPPVDDALSSPVKLFFNPSGECPNSCLTCFAEELTQVTLEDKVERSIRNLCEEFVNLLKKFPHWLKGKIEYWRRWYNKKAFIGE